jgi:hypothetical protein
MARKSKTIAGPNGEQLPVNILHPQIVNRDALVRKMIGKAEKLSEIVAAYQREIYQAVDEYLAATAESHHAKWEGNTVLRTHDGSLAIDVDVQQQCAYDERLQIASEKIRAWIDAKLQTATDPAIRKTIQQFGQIAKTALRIDHNGNIDRKKLIQLRKFEFSGEPEWKDAMDLIAAAETVIGSKRYLRFKKANPETGKLEAIPVDFSKF